MAEGRRSQRDGSRPSRLGDLPGFADWSAEILDLIKRRRARRTDDEQAAREAPVGGEHEPAVTPPRSDG